MAGFLARILPKEWKDEFEEITQGLEELGVRFATQDHGWGFEWVISDWDILRLPRERKKGAILPGIGGHILIRVREDHPLYKRYQEKFPQLLKEEEHE